MKLKQLLINCVNLYQKWLSPFKKPSCVFYPTCSQYTKQAIEKHGVLKGIRLGFFRIIRCHPWQKNHFDPIK